MNISQCTLIILLTLATTCQPMELVQCDSMKEVQEECFNLLQKLNAQPERSYKYNHYSNGYLVEEKCKAVPANYELSRTAQILCQAAQKKQGDKKAWDVHAVGCGGSQIFLVNGDCMGDGLKKSLYNDYERTECSLETLKKYITKTMHSITKGWQQTTLSEYPDISDTQPEQEWLLFVKPKTIYDEDSLFRFFAALTNVESVTDCSDLWNNNSEHNAKTLYLWIKTTHVGRVLTVLDLKIS